MCSTHLEAVASTLFETTLDPADAAAIVSTTTIASISIAIKRARPHVEMWSVPRLTKLGMTGRFVPGDKRVQSSGISLRYYFEQHALHSHFRARYCTFVEPRPLFVLWQ